MENDNERNAISMHMCAYKNMDDQQFILTVDTTSLTNKGGSSEGSERTLSSVKTTSTGILKQAYIVQLQFHAYNQLEMKNKAHGNTATKL